MPRIIMTIVQIALLLGSIYIVGDIYQKQRVMPGIQQIHETSNETPASVQPAETMQKPHTAYQAIALRDLFQTTKDKPPPKAKIDLATLKPTELKLKLWGTITGEDGLTRAVIEDQTSHEQAFFRAGEEIASAKIKMILREKVVLSVKGEDQILEIEKPMESNRQRIVTSVAPTMSNIRPVTGTLPTTSQESAPRSIRMKLSRLGSIPDDPEDWNNDTIVSPFVDESGQGQSGLMINRLTPSSPLRRLGIRNGDVILSINDQPVDELGDIYENLLAVSEGEVLSLNVKRRGRERQFDFQFE